jgi:hypothetical protein
MTRLCNGYDDGGQSPKLRVKKVEISQKALSLALEDMMIVISDMLNSSIVSVFNEVCHRKVQTRCNNERRSRLSMPSIHEVSERNTMGRR